MEPGSPARTLPPASGFGTYTPASAVAAAAPAAVRRRVDAIDLLRGIVMVVMLLDHTRDFVHASGVAYDPADLSRTTPLLFATRWVTHFCAPIFVFLAGTGSFLYGARGKTAGELSRFLFTRGCWFVLLELTVFRVLIFFDAHPSLLALLQVIWTIGVSMIVLSALVRLRLSVRAIAAFGVGMIVLHNLLDGVQVTRWAGPDSPVPGVGAKLFAVLHLAGPFPVAGWPSPLVLVLYPLIPWVGVLAAGYAFGAVYTWDAERRQRFLLRVGTAVVVAFLALRAFNYAGNPVRIGANHGYGDPNPWRTEIQGPRPAVNITPAPGAAQNAPAPMVKLSPTFVVLSFLNTSKYPPSLLFLLMTLGPALLALRWFERRPLVHRGPIGALITFGRVPLFFYLLQWPTAHGMGLLLSLAAGKDVTTYFQNPLLWKPPPDFGFDLWVVYVCWAAGVALLYPLCRWFAGVKARRQEWWLGYL